MFNIWQTLGLTSIIFIIAILIIYFFYYIYILNFSYDNNLLKHDNTKLNKISVIVPTYNEGKIIEIKMDNLLNQTYPKDKMEIIIIDSNSKDNTIKIIEDYRKKHKELNMKIIKEKERKGKSHAMNIAISETDPKSEIILMTDVDSLLKNDSIEKLILRFSDPKIGAVTGKQITPNIEDTNQTKIEGTYRNYYQILRSGESNLDSTAVFDGELSGYRANLIKDLKIREDLNADDNQLAYFVRRKGYRSISCSEAVFFEYAPSDLGSVRIQKIRRGQGLSRLFWYNKDILFNRQFGKFGSIIFPVNFFMHVISPFLVLISLFLGIVFISSYVYKNIYLLVVFIPILLSLLVLKNLLFKIKIIKTAWTFFTYQMILLEGMLMYIFGKPLYKWKKVESVRDEFVARDFVEKVN